MNLKETELRLGLPGSESPERKTVAPPGLSLFGNDVEDKKNNGFSLVSVKNSVSGSKRGFSDAIDGSGKWGFTKSGGSEVDFGKIDAVFPPRGVVDGDSKNINTLQSCLPGPAAKEMGTSPAIKPVQEKKVSPEKEQSNAPASK